MAGAGCLGRTLAALSRFIPSSGGLQPPNLTRRCFNRHFNGMSINKSESKSQLWRERLVNKPFKPMQLSFVRRTALALIGCGGVFGVSYYSLLPVDCQDVLMEDIDEEDIRLSTVKPLEMNEAAALTHTSLLRQASGVTVDASLQLLHRVLRARLDFSTHYRKQLNDVIDLLEYCTSSLHNQERHDAIWESLVISRVKMESLKDQLKDLNILVNYVFTTLENAAMAAFISGVEFTASAAQQAIDSAKLELENDTKQNLALEMQYLQTHTQHIEASQKVQEEIEKRKEVVIEYKTDDNEGLGESEESRTD
ncbi:uncharacterized protein LOC121875154 isoform X1 [Homarus americanus]|uniref:Putative Second Mitochondria-derived Activator of Caspases-containing protein n=2 Tax=Homarus americanus TaxID=6706 RepID=A0A8J5JT98_HOMAM|nr:uncharacterized protein LOC121875154 isoform X1 [Homarus americanus]KAG7161380.1 putative Second Mitochondria-derived Activator of Caspases-containing protein [Homarus americanus]